ncbi:MAG: hypothetical protein U0838_00825 [Chloroflexota bacterium]
MARAGLGYIGGSFDDGLAVLGHGRDGVVVAAAAVVYLEARRSRAAKR